jgi:hypothetical protein
MKRNTVDTPCPNAWYTQVNQPDFIPARTLPQRVVIKTISASEARDLSATLCGRGTQ